MSTIGQPSILDHVHADVTGDSEVENMIVKARHYALGLYGSQEDREATALIITGDLRWYHSSWTGEVALVLLARGRGSDARMWARATTMLDEQKRREVI
jgi:hypothetical protein